MDIKQLGFGTMRLPETAKSEIDIEAFKQMADEFIAAGGIYFDTAYPYHHGKSEGAFKKAVTDRYDRSRFLVADKLPIWFVEQPKDMRRIVDEQKQRTGLTYFDNYLVHAVSDGNFEKIESMGAFDFLKSLKDLGDARRVGFSFHGTSELLEKILNKYKFCEFVQLQINYFDWDDERARAGECYRIVRDHGLNVIVMEPVRGGFLALLPERADKILRALGDRSNASWAIQFAMSLDGVERVLSGMSSIDQMRDNLCTAASVKKMTEKERAALESAAAELRRIPLVPCTSCSYCTEGCPVGMPIPRIISAVNSFSMFENLPKSRGKYEFDTPKTKASDCIMCGQCEGVCPQHIAITRELARAAKLFD